MFPKWDQYSDQSHRVERKMAEVQWDFLDDFEMNLLTDRRQLRDDTMCVRTSRDEVTMVCNFQAATIAMFTPFTLIGSTTTLCT